MPFYDLHSAWLRYVGDPEAVAHALQQVWPLLEKGFTQHKGNVRAIERYARCPRYALRSAGPSLTPSDHSCARVVQPIHHTYLPPPHLPLAVMNGFWKSTVVQNLFHA